MANTGMTGQTWYRSFLSESMLTKIVARTCYVANILTYGNQVSISSARTVRSNPTTGIFVPMPRANNLAPCGSRIRLIYMAHHVVIIKSLIQRWLPVSSRARRELRALAISFILLESNRYLVVSVTPLQSLSSNRAVFRSHELLLGTFQAGEDDVSCHRLYRLYVVFGY